MHRLTQQIQYMAISRLIGLLSRVPRRRLSGLAVFLGWIWHGLDRYHRRIARENMIGAFGGEMRRGEIDRLVRANFVQLVRVILEIPSLLRLTQQNLNDYVVFEGAEHLHNAVSAGRGVLFFTPHMGNWELMALATALKINMPITVMVRPLDHRPADRVLTEIRSRTGNRLLDKEKSAGSVRRLMAQNQILGILLDQNASWVDGVYVPFFKRTACTTKGLAMFSMRYGATVVPVFNYRMADGRYRIVFQPSVDLWRSSDVIQDIVDNTARFNRIIEGQIRRAPDNWLWVHRRWRIKPIPKTARRKIRPASRRALTWRPV
jgi:KDO2-lipid IV(A) lauroyltransferase